MRILVLSDSHRTVRYMQLAVMREHPEHIIHLGDHSADADSLQQIFPTLPILRIRGNCDHDITCEETVVTEISGIRIFLSHGHRYGVKNGLLRLALAAKEASADVAAFGHTHSGVCELHNGLWLLNPGSCSSGCRPSYGVIEINSGVLNCRLEYFD